MREFIYRNFDHVLFVLLFISRVADIGSTYLATPNLKLEANPIAKKLGWPFALLTILVSFMAYWNTRLSVAALVFFLLVSASNIGKIWLFRTIGEDEYLELMVRMARKSKLPYAICGVLASSFLVVLVGGLLVFLSPAPEQEWGYFVGVGIIYYGGAMAFYGSLSFIKLFRKARIVTSDLNVNVAEYPRTA